MRLSEWILAVYFSYVTALSLILPISTGLRIRTIVVNGSLFGLYAVLLNSPRFLKTAAAPHLRNWTPLALMLLAYKEMGWLAPSVHPHRFESSWIVWDRVLLREWQLRDVIESTGVVFPSVLELCYLLVYGLPAFSMGMLYLYRKSRYAEVLLVIYLLGLFLSYAQFPYWPSEPPWAVFPGEDAPTVNSAIRRFNQWILGRYGIHTSVFPSAHVSGAVAAAFAFKRVLPKRAGVYRAVFVYSILVAIATVYGRYHYAVDTAAGLLVGVVAVVLGNVLLRWYGFSAAESPTSIVANL